MKGNKDEDFYEKIDDDQERLFFRLNLVKERPVFFRDKLNKRISENPNLLVKLNNYKSLKTILIFISSFSFLISFLFILIKTTYINVLTALFISLIYFILSGYFNRKIKTDLSLNKKEYKIIIEEKKILKKFSNYQSILNIIIIIFSLFLLTFSYLKSNSLLFIIIFLISLLYLLKE